MQSRILACLKRPLFDQPSVVFTACRAIGLYGTSSKFEGEQAFFSQNKGAVFAALSVVGALSSYAICCQPVNAKQLQGAPSVSNKQVPEMKSPADATSCPSPATSRLLNADDSGLPTFTVEEVAEHRDLKSGIWITYKGEVYDITEFIEAHPGGAAKIMLAAGGSIEPFWAMYKQHNKDEVRSILAQYKVGKLAGGEAASAGKALEDPFKNEPPRHPALITRSAKPCNAETPGSLLAAQIITPTDLFYVRNHLPVPEVDASAWKLKIKGEGLRTIELTMEELQTKFKKHVISTTIQCAGNRRSEMKEIKPVKGLDWNIGAIGTATFGGVLLRDVLEYAGLQENEPGVNHIHFVGLDSDPLSGEVYAASVPSHKVLSKQSDVLLAWEMNGQPLTRDHGFPLRAVVPGIIGARNVKWLSTVVASAEESDSFWQKKDYKPFSPGVDWDNVDWDSAAAIQEAPITSAVCEPEPGSEIYLSDGEITTKGYAWSGGGRDVIRVDVSADGGKTWHVAKLQKLNQRPGRAWAWSIWEATLPLPEGVKVGDEVELVCRAVDDNCCAQPDGVEGLWNMRGVLNNAWHRLHLTVV